MLYDQDCFLQLSSVYVILGGKIAHIIYVLGYLRLILKLENGLKSRKEESKLIRKGFPRVKLFF